MLWYFPFIDEWRQVQFLLSNYYNFNDQLSTFTNFPNEFTSFSFLFFNWGPFLILGVIAVTTSMYAVNSVAYRLYCTLLCWNHGSLNTSKFYWNVICANISIKYSMFFPVLSHSRNHWQLAHLSSVWDFFDDPVLL